MAADLDCHVTKGLPREPYVGEGGPFWRKRSACTGRLSFGTNPDTPDWYPQR